jgi:hypothetical protein
MKNQAAGSVYPDRKRQSRLFRRWHWAHQIHLFQSARRSPRGWQFHGADKVPNLPPSANPGETPLLLFQNRRWSHLYECHTSRVRCILRGWHQETSRALKKIKFNERKPGFWDLCEPDFLILAVGKCAELGGICRLIGISQTAPPIEVDKSVTDSEFHPELRDHE